MNIASVRFTWGASAPRFFTWQAGWRKAIYAAACLFFLNNFFSTRIPLSTCFSSSK